MNDQRPLCQLCEGDRERCPGFPGCPVLMATRRAPSPTSAPAAKDVGAASLTSNAAPHELSVRAEVAALTNAEALLKWILDDCDEWWPSLRDDLGDFIAARKFALAEKRAALNKR